MPDDVEPKAPSLKRRSFLQLGALAGVAGAVGSPHAATAAEPLVFANKPDYLACACNAARWIRSAEITKDGGGVWLPEPDHPEKAATISLPNGFYSGSAGTLLFFLELAEATGDRSYSEDAKRGDYLVRSWRDSMIAKAAVPGAQLGFLTGLAGTIFGLTALWQATKISAYRDEARAATAALIKAARPAGGGIEWASSCGLPGDSGILLALLHTIDTFGDRSNLAVAIKAGDRIVERGEADPRGGIRWQGMPPAQLGEPEGAYWPNFQLGTSGVAFALARLHAATHEPRFLKAAKAGALHLQRIATIRDDAALIHYREPDAMDIFYLGYCNGPAGTARLFYELYKITKDPDYLDWTERLARGVMASGIPERQTPGFWNVVCQCCGSAGVVDFFLGLRAATGRPDYLDFATRVADQMLSRESDLDGKGYRWYQAYTRVKPSDVSAETGYMIGAAGIGAALLHLDGAQQRRYRAIASDNPLPTAYGG